MMHYRKWAKTHRAPLIAVGFWLILLVLTRQYMQVNNLTFNGLTEQLSAFLKEPAFGPLLFMAIYFLRPLILFPASLLTVLGGNIFGLGAGFLYVWTAGTISALIPFAVGRWFSTGSPQRIGEDSRLQRFVGKIHEHPFQTILAARLLFLPYDAVSLLAGSLKIPLSSFLVATALGNAVGTFSYVGIGASVKGILTTGQVSFDPSIFLLSAGVLIASLLLPRLWNAYRMRHQSIEIEDMQ